MSISNKPLSLNKKEEHFKTSITFPFQTIHRVLKILSQEGAKIERISYKDVFPGLELWFLEKGFEFRCRSELCNLSQTLNLRFPETWTSALNFEFGNLPGFALWLWKLDLNLQCFKSFGTLGLGRKLIFLKFTTFNTFKFRIHPGVIKFTALENNLSDEVDVAGTATYILAI
ncbi:unnamed protein product [Rhizophagus irregularis]|nr:unnamed protein product [Rhizophagus irregularis]CAB5212276.1 unnamed protein product [Rhizophagus irregularis]